MYAGEAQSPLASLADAVNVINFFQDLYASRNASSATIYVKNSGSAGGLTTIPVFLNRLNIYRDPASTTTPEIAGVDITGAISVHIKGPMNLLKRSTTSQSNYNAYFGANLTLEDCSFNFSSPAAGASFVSAQETGIVSFDTSVTSIGNQPTYGVAVRRATVFRGGSTIAGSSGDFNTNGTIVS